MALFKLGRAPEARAMLARLEDVMNDHNEALRYYNPATGAWFEESKYLLEDSGVQIEPPVDSERGE